MRETAVNTVFWSGVERYSVILIQFIVILIISRILPPSDFGLIAIMNIFLAIAQTFIDSGFANALIQKQDRTQIDYSTVFYFNIVVSVAVYALIYGVSPAIARFYNDPQLDILMKVIGLNLIFLSFAIVQRARLTIAFNFKLQALISLISTSVSGLIGIWMAYSGYGVWALVYQSLINVSVNTLLFWILNRWIPSWCFSITSFRQLFPFGVKLLFAGLLQTLYTNLYTLVIGKKYSATDVGFYSRAVHFTSVISNNLSLIIVRAVYPVLCNLQDDDEILKRTFIKYIRVSSFVVFPLMVSLLVLSKPLITVLLTEKWLFSAELLQILCLAQVWQVLMGLNACILNVKGRTDYTLKSEVYKKICALLILFVTLPWGMKALCWGLVAYSHIDLFISTRFTKKILQIGLFTELKVLSPVLFLTFVMGIVMWMMTGLFETPFLKLIAGGLMGFIVYAGGSLVFRFREWGMLKDLLKRK